MHGIAIGDDGVSLVVIFSIRVYIPPMFGHWLKCVIHVRHAIDKVNSTRFNVQENPFQLVCKSRDIRKVLR